MRSLAGLAVVVLWGCTEEAKPEWWRWELQQSISGSAVILDERTLAVSAATGGIVVYDELDGGWVEQQRLLGNNSVFPLAIRGGLMALQERSEDHRVVIRVFERRGVRWEEQAELSNPERSADFSGGAAFVDETTLVASLGPDSDTQRSASIVTFHREGEQWVPMPNRLEGETYLDCRDGQLLSGSGLGVRARDGGAWGERQALTLDYPRRSTLNGALVGRHLWAASIGLDDSTALLHHFAAVDGGWSKLQTWGSAGFDGYGRPEIVGARDIVAVSGFNSGNQIAIYEIVGEVIKEHSRLHHVNGQMMAMTPTHLAVTTGDGQPSINVYRRRIY